MITPEKTPDYDSYHNLCEETNISTQNRAPTPIPQSAQIKYESPPPSDNYSDYESDYEDADLSDFVIPSPEHSPYPFQGQIAVLGRAYRLNPSNNTFGLSNLNYPQNIRILKESPSDDNDNSDPDCEIQGVWDPETQTWDFIQDPEPPESSS